MSVSASDFDDRWDHASKPERDWKKIFLMVGLGILSWVATYVGMLELIEANLGDLPIMHKLIIASAVAMLMTMIIWLLDQIFAPVPLITKFIYVMGYIFLTAISVGFGFGFYWKVLESRSETTRSASSAVSQVQGALVGATARLDQLEATLTNLTTISREKAGIERAKGTSCPNSRPGDGPRRQLRDDDASQFSFASDFVAARATQIKAELKVLDASLAMITKSDPKTLDASGNRNEFMRTLNGKLDGTVARYNAFRSDPQLRQFRANFAERANKTLFPTSNGGNFSCPDPQLQMALQGVVRAIDQLPDVSKPKINAVEGSEATIEAFRRLGASFYGALSLKMPPSADELREMQKRAVLSMQSGEQQVRSYDIAQSGLSQRDYIPLAIAMFVDLCLLLVAMGRPMNRLNGLIPTMRAAEQGPMYDILSKFSEIHKTPEVRAKFEVFRHVVFDFSGDYYVAVPLDAPYRPTSRHGAPYSTDDIDALQQEAHLLANFFASFEKKRIFTRVYSPFLTTSSIQKRLHRQGSKFANSKAFRVYRFRDGAWSEIILNTIMRAAREVEVTRRRQATVAGPRLDVPVATPASSLPEENPRSEPRPVHSPVHPKARLDRRSGFRLSGLDDADPEPRTWQPQTPYGVARPRPYDEADVEVTFPSHHQQQFGKYAQHATQELSTQERAMAEGRQNEGQDQGLDDDFAQRSVRPLVKEATTPRSAGRQMTDAGTPARPFTADEGNVVPFEPTKTGPRTQLVTRDSDPLPRMFTSGQAAVIPNSGVENSGVDVVLTEREARFTVPTPDAILPSSLRQALSEAARNAGTTTVTSANLVFIDTIADAVSESEQENQPDPQAEPQEDDLAKWDDETLTR